MTLQDLIDAYRQRADDAVAPYHVKDEDLAKFASEAESEACIRARLLYDDISPDLTTIAVVANQPVYDLDPLVDRIESAEFAPSITTRRRALELTGMDDLREECDWSARTCSRPFKAVHLPSQKSIRIWPTPSVAGTLYLSIYRLPLFPMEDPDDEPEIGPEHHEGLVCWMLYRVYSTNDSELRNEPEAGRNLADFIERFGERPSADVLRRYRDRKRITTRYGGL